MQKEQLEKILGEDGYESLVYVSEYYNSTPAEFFQCEYADEYDMTQDIRPILDDINDSAAEMYREEQAELSSYHPRGL